MQKSIFRIEKFLGLNESLAETELKMGEASKMVNFEITREGNIRRRPGILKRGYDILSRPFAGSAKLTGVWSGFLSGYNSGFTIACVFGNFTYTDAEAKTFHSAVEFYKLDGSDMTPYLEPRYMEDTSLKPSMAFYLGNTLWVRTDTEVFGIDSLGKPSAPYIPTIVTGAKPGGGGTSLENVNTLSDEFYLEYSGDGTTKGYKLPDIVNAVAEATVDGKVTQGTYHESTKIFTFGTPPVEGVNNVKFKCSYADEELTEARRKFFAMRHHEFYNGDTEGRVFFYGDGGNVALYTGVPAFGTGLYIPAGNEIAFTDSPAPITGMSRQDSSLIVTKPDMTYSVKYSPITLADGKVIAGFYPRILSKEIGNDYPGQLVLCGNYTRAITKGTVYEWHSTASYQDQKYTKDIGRNVSRTLRGTRKVIAVDDDVNATCYILADRTLLVNRYDIDAWAIYEADAFADVDYAVCEHGSVYFLSPDGISTFVEGQDMDIDRRYFSPSPDDVQTPIKAIWESGFMHFGADWRKKYSSDLWISTFPEPSSRMVVTVHTDKRNGYARKVIGNNIFDWYNNVDYANWSYNVSRTPKMKRTKIKVKKFVYYQLCFEVESPGARATVLSADMAVNFAGPVK